MEDEGDCPVCGKTFPQTTLPTHANICLDAKVGMPGLVRNERVQATLSTTVAQSASPCTQLSFSVPSAGMGSPSRTESWLRIHGLEKYTPSFLSKGMHTVCEISNALPRTAGACDNVLRTHYSISTLGARRKIVSAICAWRSEAAENSTKSPMRSPKERTETKQEPSFSHETCNVETESTKKRPFAFFFAPGYNVRSAEALAAAAKRPKPGLLVPGPDGQQLFQKNGKQKEVPKLRGNSKPRSEGDSGKVIRKPRRHAFCKRVPGTSFTVDSFKAVGSDSCKNYFLTHMHSDHYGGLTKGTLSEGSFLLCSEITGALAKHILRVPESRIRVLPMQSPVRIEDHPAPNGQRNGATVWLYPANHCPGAVVFLFYVWATSRYILHTGDCRYDPVVFGKHEELVNVVRANKLDFLFLDTTYANPRHNFPHQRTVLDKVVSAARNENERTRGRCLFFFGTYTIGKEKVFLEVAEALDLKIFADQRKHAILSKLGMPCLSARLVTNAGLARIHVVGMGSLSADGLRSHAKKNGLNNYFIGRGLAIVFRPTGWTYKGPQVGDEFTRRVVRNADQAVSYEIPYSEHSSFEELQAFVKWAKPARVIPTVGFHSEKEAAELASLLGHEKRPLDRAREVRH